MFACCVTKPVGFGTHRAREPDTIPMLGHLLGVETSGGASLATGSAGDHRPQAGHYKRQVEGYSVV